MYNSELLSQLLWRQTGAFFDKMSKMRLIIKIKLMRDFRNGFIR